MCTSCSEKGFTPGNYEKHLCTQCQQQLGALKFEKEVLRDFKRRKTSKLVCKDCQSKLRCAACEGAFDEKWSLSERKNHRTLGTALVCKVCRQKGYHAHDVRSYTCTDCSGNFGGKHFDAKQFDNHNQRGGSLQCRNCTAGAKQRERQDVERERRIQDRLKKGRDGAGKPAWKCTCKKINHEEKCALFPTQHGVRKWPGKNVGITEDDIEFLAKRQKRQ